MSARKLTENQQNILSCLTNDFQKFGVICEKYAIIQASKGYNSASYAWKSEVSRLLPTLCTKGLVEYKYTGLYRLADK